MVENAKWNVRIGWRVAKFLADVSDGMGPELLTHKVIKVKYSDWTLDTREGGWWV